MQRPKDFQGRKWDILIDAPNYRRIKEETGIDITLIRYPRRDGSGLSLGYELIESALVILDIAWAICEPQAHRMNVERDEFDRVVSARMRDFRQAVIAEILDFFQTLGMATEAEVLRNLQPVMDKGKAAAVKQMMKDLGSQDSGDTPGPTPTTPSNTTPESQESAETSAA